MLYEQFNSYKTLGIQRNISILIITSFACVHNQNRKCIKSLPLLEPIDLELVVL